MYRLSLIISEVFNKYLPLADQAKVQLNLDFSDTTQQVAHPEAVKHDLDQQLSSALQHTVGGEISVAVTNRAITITDAATVLSPAASTDPQPAPKPQSRSRSTPTKTL